MDIHEGKSIVLKANLAAVKRQAVARSLVPTHRLCSAVCVEGTVFLVFVWEASFCWTALKTVMNSRFMHILM